ncbi:MAG: hybrid sensor histidine kinase/response regulator, partial [Magnetococcales bacterium]|nr:hybrid sensor histidine kinase/response regulator [Magnetococcales bacterium]
MSPSSPAMKGGSVGPLPRWLVGPLVDPEREPMPAETTTKPILLIVDDTPEYIDLLRAALQSDFTVRVALDGPRALKVAQIPPLPDLILLDIVMPEMSGYEVCRRLKENLVTRDIPVIFVTGRTEAEDEVTGLNLGAVDYITKPIRVPIVRARVRTHVQLKFAHRELRLAAEKLAGQYRELVEADRLKQDVERIARHDLKTPLNGIIGFSDLLLQDETLAQDHRQKVKSIWTSGIKALHMVNLSLGLLHMEQGSYVLEPVDFDLLSLIRTLRDDLSSWIFGRSLTLEVRVDSRPMAATDAFWVRGEEVLCYSMLANLVRNALEASPEHGQVTLELAAGDGVAKLAIHNRGSVPEAVRDRFFEKYVSAGKNTGTGLGTYSARLIAETMGGGVRLVRTSDEEGTVIEVTLPLGEAPVRGNSSPRVEALLAPSSGSRAPDRGEAPPSPGELSWDTGVHPGGRA